MSGWPGSVSRSPVMKASQCSGRVTWSVPASRWGSVRPRNEAVRLIADGRSEASLPARAGVVASELDADRRGERRRRHAQVLTLAADADLRPASRARLQ